MIGTLAVVAVFVVMVDVHVIFIDSVAFVDVVIAVCRVVVALFDFLVVFGIVYRCQVCLYSLVRRLRVSANFHS